MRRVAGGSPFSFELMFTTDLPSGALTYTLLGNNNATRIAASPTVAAGALSYAIVIPASDATIATGLMFENRTLSYSYPTANGVVSGVVRYRVDAFLPFGATTDGVRNKLGALDAELLDEDIDLIYAYLLFVGPRLNLTALTAAQTSGSLVTLQVIDAIEAQAAINLLPSLQVKLAVARSSGTNTFERTNKMDWEALKIALWAIVAIGANAIDIPTNPAGGSGFIFGLSVRTDPVTGR